MQDIAIGLTFALYLKRNDMKKLIAAILMLLAFAYASNFDHETAKAEQTINQQTAGK